MTVSLIKMLSITIFIAEEQKKSILTILLYDYAKTLVSKKQFILLHILVHSYREKNIHIKKPLYGVIQSYIRNHGNHLCKNLLYK